MGFSSGKSRPISRDEFRAAFDGAGDDKLPAILTPGQLAGALKVSRNTVYFWIEKGRFDGAFRKRGKHIRIWRDRALDLFFNGPEWPSMGDMHEN